MRQRTCKGERLSWAWRYLSHEGRFALLILHRLPRNHPDRIEAAKGLRKFLANRVPRGILGWSEGRSAARFGDSTGIYHAVVAERKGEYVVTRAACDPRRQTYGQLERTASRGYKCRTCAKIAAKHRKEATLC